LAAIVFLAIELRYGRRSSIVVSHLDKTKAARTAGLAIVNDVGRLDCACGSKMFLQILACHAK
jgi:hypothetical protein